MTLTDLLSRFDNVVEEEDGYVVRCPAHADSVESLRITVSDTGKVLVKCRAGCQTGTVMDALGLSLRDLATMSAEGFDLSPATSKDAPASPAQVAALAVDLDRWAEGLVDEGCEEALAYAERRFGLTAHDAARLGLGVARDLPGGPRLVVPFRDRDGVARGYQARALEPDARVRWLGPKSPDGASWAKVGYFEGGSGWDEVLITEGPGDALTGVGLGYDTACIRGAGLASNPTVIDAVVEMVGDRLAVICGDGDPSGRTFASNLAQALLERDVRVKILPVPDDHDLTSWREENPSRFAATIIRAISDQPEEVGVGAVLRDRDKDRYPFTDLGNARFVRDFILARSSGVKFSPEAGFFLLRSGIWREDKLDQTRAYVQDAADLTEHIAKRLHVAASNQQEEQEALAWRKWATYSQSTRGISAALKELSALREVATDVSDFDQHPDLMAVGNGVIDLRTGELMPHDPSLLLTKRISVDYDPDAKAPRWTQFLDEIFPNHPDLPAFIQRLVGYGITGHTNEQTFAVLWGTGANGKSVLTDTLTEVFRELTVTTPFSTFEEKPSGGIPNDLAALRGARLVMAAEGEQGRPMAEAVLKRVTGRDVIAARFMRREFFEFRPSFLLMLATNFKPNFKGQDEGLWRRVKLIPFERYFRPEERDHHLGDALLDEKTGILTWAVEGARRWYASGLNDPKVIVNATSEYRETSDALAGFLPGVFIKDPAAPLIDGKMLFEEYLKWADEENLPAKDRWTRRTFYGSLEERGAVKRATKRGVGFAGIRRMRTSDRVEEVRAEEEPQADSSSDTTTAAPTRGADLDDVL